MYDCGIMDVDNKQSIIDLQLRSLSRLVFIKKAKTLNKYLAMILIIILDNISIDVLFDIPLTFIKHTLSQEYGYCLFSMWPGSRKPTASRRKNVNIVFAAEFRDLLEFYQ